jgi:hypothetical protein
MVTSLPFDWFILLLRLLFIFLLYFFLYQVVRVTSRELAALAGAAPAAPVPAGQAASGRLVVVEDGGGGLRPGESFALDPVSTVGRRPDCTVVIDEPFVSSEHGELRFSQGRWWLRDLGSTNGTLLNGAPVTVATGVKSGDVIQVGRVKLRLVP